nr:FAD-dependent monooxygenase [Novosphingobium mathurense]
MNVDVVIAGAGAAGLSAAIELGRRGINVVILECLDKDDYRGPRTYLINSRSMEHLRRWGIADRLAERNPIDPEMQPDVIFATRLNGYLLHRFDRPFVGTERVEEAAENAQWIPQRSIEETMIELVNTMPTVKLLWRHALVSFTEVEDGVSCVATDPDGKEFEISGKYLVGADGSKSLVRKSLGIRLQGRGNMLAAFVYHVRVPELKRISKVGHSSFYWFVNGSYGGYSGVTINCVREGEYSIGSFPCPPGIDASDEAQVRKVIYAGFGEETPMEFIGGRSYNMHAIIAPEMLRGRVAIAGDAAHLLPNLGGFGFNVGLLDGVDIGWKLAYLLKGWGGDRLLLSYQNERQEALNWVAKIQIENVDVLSHDIYMPGLEDDTPEGERLRQRAKEIIVREKTQEFHSLGTQKGYRLTKSEIISDDGSPPAPTDAIQYFQTSRPGSLAPHAWLTDGSSLYDHFGPEFTLVVRDGSAAEVDSTIAVDVPIKVLVLPDPAIAKLYDTRFTLVRPDQMVAWRGDELPEDLAGLMARLTGRAASAATH